MVSFPMDSIIQRPVTLQNTKRTFLSWNVYFTLLVIACWISPLSSQELSGECDTETKLYAEDLDLNLFQDSASIPSYYRYLTIDLKSNYLFVGAMNRIYGLFLNNIAHESKRLKQHFGPPSENTLHCKIRGNTGNLECQNHVRLLIRNSSQPDMFYMCSTGAYSPITYQLKLENNEFRTISENRKSFGFCAFDPNDNATAILVERGTPGNIPSLFAGTYADPVKSDPIFWRISLEKSDTNTYMVRTKSNKWLNEPQFVKSFDVGDYVYVFFREVALEYANCGKKVYSRVARVCKNDSGGFKPNLKNGWLSFVKARLNCSIPGEYPYYFDEIQDVFMSGDRFYALFTTNINGLTASAICVYDVEDIDRSIRGLFKDQANPQSLWLPVNEKKVGKPRPGDCDALKTLARDGPMPYTLMTFLHASSMLLNKAVSHTYGKPIFFKSNSIMQKMVGVQDIGGRNEFVFFTATNTGLIYKIAAWPGLTPLDAPKTYIVSTYIPFTDTRPIWSLLMHEQWIYFGTDMAVGQISVQTCSKYNKIDLCIYDPYCGWDKILRECHSNKRQNLITYGKIDLLSYSLEEAVSKHVGKLYISEKLSKSSGSSVTLDVDYLLHINGAVTWSKDEMRIPGKRHILAKDNSLIVTDLREADKGVYRAVDESGRIVSEYALEVETTKDQIEQRWMRKFDQWCDEFERYKEDVRQWERKCESCCQDTALTSMVPALGGK